MTTTNCPACSRTLRVPEELLGQLVKCPSCGHTFTAADEAEPPPVPPQYVPPREAPEPIPLQPDEDRPPPRPSRRVTYEEDDDYRPRRPAVPGKAQAIAIMTLIGGILAIVTGSLYAVGSGGVCCLWPGTYYSIVMGIMATIKGSQLLGQDARNQPPPRGIAIMQIINIINLDVPNCVMGILTLVFLSDPEVQRYYRTQ